MLNFGNKEFRNLQEQVLKNAQDIEVLKNRENLQIVIVEELPEEGNPNYIYLVPNEDAEESNVYSEYIWLSDEEAYEEIGGVSIDLTNYVTLDTNQTISGEKTIEDKPVSFFHTGATGAAKWHIEEDSYGRLTISRTYNNIKTTYWVFDGSSILPYATNTINLGFTNRYLKEVYANNVYIGVKADFGNDALITKDSSNRINIQFAGSSIIKVGATSYIKASWVPEETNTYDLGSSTYCWKDAYIAGNISDGVNSVSVANIASKVTSSAATGTFDASGEDTIDISGGTPEGLFIFTYGNCQCFVRLTATMVQNADAVPINVSCPMIYNNTVSLGWFSISRGGTTITITVTDGVNHVDSGYSWTLTKTNLL